MKDLKEVYRAQIKALAEQSLEALKKKWRGKYPIVIESWQNNWEELSTYFEYTQPIRKLIYTTNTVEGYHRQIRKVTKTKRGLYKQYVIIEVGVPVNSKYSKKVEKPIA